MSVRSATPASSTASGSGWYLAAICLVASIGGLLFGFDTAVISGAIDLIAAQFNLDPWAKGLFAAAALFGCIGGAAMAGAAGDRFGRKPILIVSAVLFFASSIGCAIAPEYWQLFIARVVAGIGIGMASVLAPMYISEFAPPHLRGRLVATYQLSIVIGILAAYFSNWQLTKLSAGDIVPPSGWLHWVMVDEVWRAMLGVGVLPSAAFLILLVLVPESPRWLARAGRVNEARTILSRIAGRDADRQMAEIEQSLAREEGSFTELLKPGLRMALLVAVMLSVFGQLSGVNIVVYYGPSILKAAGFGDIASLFGQVGIGLINLVVTIVALLVVDNLGRRPLLVGGMAAVTVVLAIIGGLFLYGVSGVSISGDKIEVAGKISPSIAIAIAVMIGAYMAAIAISICAVIWVLTPEFFPNRVRGRGVSVATFANWGTNCIGVYLFPWFVARFGMHAAFFTSAGICLVATWFFWQFVPETKGKTLEEIEKHWLKH
jgi:SP family arabinose:H+ symporter-like MFS transporter